MTRRLSDASPQEPVLEPVKEPKYGLDFCGNEKPVSRKTTLRDLPPHFPDAEGQLLISERFAVAGLSIDAVAEAERFRDYQLARGNRSADWTATLRMWISKSIDFAQSRSGNASPAHGRAGEQWSALEVEVHYLQHLRNFND